MIQETNTYNCWEQNMAGKTIPKLCYRLRPMNDLTIDELDNHYLWFSKRAGFKDKYDANIGAFIMDTPQIEKGLQLRYTKEGINELVRQMDNIGICCFTKKLPSPNTLHKFPKGKQSICVEYNKDIIEDFFLNSIYALAYPFKNVVYSEEPTKIESDGSYHILTKKHKNGYEYSSINAIFSDVRKEDKLFELLLTRVNIKYKKQKEMRIILGGRNLDYFDVSQAGYKIEIPQEAISKVILINNPNPSFRQKLERIDSIKNKIWYPRIVQPPQPDITL